MLDSGTPGSRGYTDDSVSLYLDSAFFPDRFPSCRDHESPQAHILLIIAEGVYLLVAPGEFIEGFLIGPA